jgi:hypothetical protein
MITDRRRSDLLIDELVADLAPVRPRRWHRGATLILLAVAAEALVTSGLLGMRPDMPEAMLTLNFWWKAGGLALLAGLGSMIMLLSLNPAVGTLPRLRWAAVFVLLPLALASGWLLDAGSGGMAALAARLNWREGLHCATHVVAMAVPLLLLLAVLIRRGAPTRPERTARAAGLAAAGLGAVGFVLTCPYDDPLYVAVWYGAAVAVVTLAAQLLLPRLIRW